MSRSIDSARIPATPLAKVTARTAAEICRHVELSPEGRAGLLPTLSPQGFLAVLMGNRRYADAVRFLAHAVPPREGVWWACVVAAQTNLSLAAAACLDQAEAWVYQGGEAERRACHRAAETLGFQGAAAYAALAAFWSGGSLAPEGGPEVPPHESLVHIGVGASLLLAVAVADPLTSDDLFGEVVARGIDIASGGNGRLSGDRPRATAKGSAIAGGAA